MGKTKKPKEEPKGTLVFGRPVEIAGERFVMETENLAVLRQVQELCEAAGDGDVKAAGKATDLLLGDGAFMRIFGDRNPSQAEIAKLLYFFADQITEEAKERQHG